MSVLPSMANSHNFVSLANPDFSNSTSVLSNYSKELCNCHFTSPSFIPRDKSEFENCGHKASFIPKEKSKRILNISPTPLQSDKLNSNDLVHISATFLKNNKHGSNDVSDISPLLFKTNKSSKSSLFPKILDKSESFSQISHTFLDKQKSDLSNGVSHISPTSVTEDKPAVTPNSISPSFNTKEKSNLKNNLSPKFLHKGNLSCSTPNCDHLKPFCLLLNMKTNLNGIKVPKSYGTYSKVQQDEVIAFIKEGNSLRTAEKVYGIPKSTMHCWLKKLNALNNIDVAPTMTEVSDYSSLTPPSSATEEKKFFANGPSKISANKTNSKVKTQQVIIEEAELIRFLQTSEGLELIAKAYRIPISEFHSFISQVKKKQTTKKVPLTALAAGEKKILDSRSLSDVLRKSVFNSTTMLNDKKKDTYTAMMNGHKTEVVVRTRKRNVFSKESYIADPKKVRKELKPLSLHSKKNTVQRNYILTPEQLLAASKLISNIQPGSVSTYIMSQPLQVPPSTVVSQIADHEQISSTFPKTQNLISVKPEHTTVDCTVVKPTSLPYSSNSRVTSHVTRPTISSNKTAWLNLNEINRSQSEKELMALVDGDDITADELCVDFNDSMELNSMVDNENWYTDQYFQYFQVNPVTEAVSPNEILSSPLSLIKQEVKSEEENLHDDDDDDDDDSEIFFTSNNEKEKIISFIAQGHSVLDAEKHFDVPRMTIASWLTSTSNIDEDGKCKYLTDKCKAVHSAFCKPSKNMQTNSTISVFSKPNR